jgi:peptide/nickel transport system ATP-binding protein
MNLLAVRDLAVSFANGAKPVDGVSFDIARGECFALLGESGCGKSMTALALMRLLPPGARVAASELRLENRDVLALPETDMQTLRGGRMGMIFQEPMTSLNPVMTVGEQIGESLALHRGLAGRAARAEAVRLLSTVGVPDPYSRVDDYPFQLSGGLRQRVMIAIALAGEPELLIADEPTTALDVSIQAQVLELLGELRRARGMGLLLITHDLAVVAEMADRVAVMYAGQLVEIAARSSFLNQPAHPYTRRLLEALPERGRRARTLTTIPGAVPRLDRGFTGCRFAERCAHVMPRCREEAPELRLVGAGQVVRCHWNATASQARGVESLAVPRGPREATFPRLGPRAESASGGPSPSWGGPATDLSAPLVSVTELRVHFPIRKGFFKRTVGHVKAVDGVSLNIARGETLALVGESGCGKTTVAKALLRLIPHTSGELGFDGTNLGALRGEALRAARRDFQIVFQDPFSSLDPRMRVADILAEGAQALGVPGTDTVAALARVGLPADAASRYPHEFSGGQRQRIAIARALAVKPAFLALDEPTSALDVSVQAQIVNLLRELQAELGLAYLFITHNLGLVGYLAQRVAVMYLGRIVEEGPVDAVMDTPRHPYTRALLSAVPSLEGKRERIRLPGDPPSPIDPPAGCPFHPRCREARPECAHDVPAMREPSAGQRVWCHLYR